MVEGILNAAKAIKKMENHKDIKQHLKINTILSDIKIF